MNQVFESAVLLVCLLRKVAVATRSGSSQ